VIDIDKSKNKIYRVDLSSLPEKLAGSKGELRLEEFTVEMPKLYVPFDFDGERILYGWGV
jgi:hypothetical protein